MSKTITITNIDGDIISYSIIIPRENKGYSILSGKTEIGKPIDLDEDDEVEDYENNPKDI